MIVRLISYVFAIFFVSQSCSAQNDRQLNSATKERNKEQFLKKGDSIHNLFNLLYDENDTIAWKAFKLLSVSNPEKVIEVSKLYKQTYEDPNWIVPSFTFNVLPQIVKLTSYCKENNIDFIGTNDLKTNIETLKNEELNFEVRYELENKLIKELTLENITSFEYWSIMNEGEGYLQYSAGRILDRFYSINWHQLISNPKYLDSYLKKSQIYSNIGIIGICNDYLLKFRNSSQATLETLENHKASNEAVSNQIDSAMKLNNTPFDRDVVSHGKWWRSQDYKITDLEKKLNALLTNIVDSAKTDREIVELLSKISYEQIGIAMKAIESYKSYTTWSKYSFLQRDFGLMYYNDFDDSIVRNEFIALYSRKTELELHTYFLKRVKTDYLNEDGSLDFDKIYTILKFDISDGFVGGGAGKEDNVVYSIVKVLEYHFQNTLIFSRKYCNGENIMGCDAGERATAWMRYLEENKLLLKEHNEPESFLAKPNKND